VGKYKLCRYCVLLDPNPEGVDSHCIRIWVPEELAVVGKSLESCGVDGIPRADGHIVEILAEEEEPE